MASLTPISQAIEFINALIYYGIILILLLIFILGLRSLYRKKVISAIVLFLAVIFPIALYLSPSAENELINKERIELVKSWPRKEVTDRDGINSMIVTDRGHWTIPSLLYTGVLQGIAFVGQNGDVQKVLKVRRGRRCPSVNGAISAKFDLRGAAMAKNAFQLCHVTGLERDNEDFSAPIWLYLDHVAPSRNLLCGGNVSGNTLELRWSPQNGADLIAFEEIPWFEVLRPHSFSSTKCERSYDRQDQARFRELLDPFNFAARALGYTTIDDFPRLANEEDALEAIRLLNEQERHKAAYPIALLLGQWPSIPEISEYIRSSIRDGRIVYRVLTTLASDDADLSLLPHLASHKADFIEICDQATSYTNYCDRWSKKLLSESNEG